MIQQCVQAGISKIFIETDEPERVYQFIPEVEKEIVAQWNPKKGIEYQVTENKTEIIKCTEKIEEALNYLIATRKKYLILFFAPPDYDLLHLVPNWHTVIFVAPRFKDFPGAVRVTLPQPSAEEYEQAFKVALKPKQNKALVRAHSEYSAGMRVSDAVNCFKYSVFTGTEFVQNRHKFIRSQIIEFVNSPYTFKDVGGFLDFKFWFQNRKYLYKKEAKEYGLNMPKGVVITGIPGTGKSLISKALGNEAKLPLIRFDLARVYDQYVGQSEANLYNALRSIEQAAPAIVWVEELGRLTVGKDSQGDSGTTSRLLSILLTWLQEHDKDIFVVATVNDVQNIPEELLRKGRFSRIEEVPRPDREVRREVWEIHLRRNDIPIYSRYATEWLADNSQGMTGADIEANVIDTMIEAYNKGLAKEHTVAEYFMTDDIRPLSQKEEE